MNRKKRFRKCFRFRQDIWSSSSKIACLCSLTTTRTHNFFFRYRDLHLLNYCCWVCKCLPVTFLPWLFLVFRVHIVNDYEATQFSQMSNILLLFRKFYFFQNKIISRVCQRSRWLRGHSVSVVLTTLTSCRRSCWPSRHCVSIVVDNAGTRFLTVFVWDPGQIF